MQNDKPIHLPLQLNSKDNFFAIDTIIKEVELYHRIEGHSPSPGSNKINVDIQANTVDEVLESVIELLNLDMEDIDEIRLDWLNMPGRFVIYVFENTDGNLLSAEQREAFDNGESAVNEVCYSGFVFLNGEPHSFESTEKYAHLLEKNLD